MEASPLVQLPRPSFQPKVARLYEELFVSEEEHSTGYWAEFFHLKPDRTLLQQRLDAVGPDDLLHFQDESQQLFLHAVEAIKAQVAPSDEIALDTLTVYLAAVLSKRYTNPSSDIITVLTGLDEVDAIFLDFANAIEANIRSARPWRIRKRAIRVALALTSGAYQTSLVSYFTHRDLFPALVKYIQDAKATQDEPQDGSPSEDVFEPFLLLGLLANYNKFEYRNPYRMRMEDFVNESATSKMSKGLRVVLDKIRDQYVDVQQDQLDTTWSLSNTLSSIGLGVLAPIKAITPNTAPEDESKEKFAVLPDSSSAVLLGIYDFALANNLFCFNLVSDTANQSKHGDTFSSFLSLSSYINHHAYRSHRASLYGLLSLIILRVLVEDAGLCKRICDQNVKMTVRLCRQRQPTLPVVTSGRSAAAQILDICVDTINHNLRKRLDLDLYTASLDVIHRIIICLAQNRNHLIYHWSQVWQSLIALLRFVQKFADALKAHSTGMMGLVSLLTKVVALSIAYGVNFLPDSAAHDDLFYKLVECRPVLQKLSEVYNLNDSNSAMSVLNSTATHFHDILESKGLMSRALGAKEVTKVIRSGYESLEVPDVARLNLESFKRWREGDEKIILKKMARVAVEDTKRVLLEQ